MQPWVREGLGADPQRVEHRESTAVQAGLQKSRGSRDQHWGMLSAMLLAQGCPQETRRDSPALTVLFPQSTGVCTPPSMVDASHLPPPPPPPDPQFVLRGTQSAVHALHFHRGDEAQGHPFLFSG